MRDVILLLLSFALACLLAAPVPFPSTTFTYQMGFITTLNVSASNYSFGYEAGFVAMGITIYRGNGTLYLALGDKRASYTINQTNSKDPFTSVPLTIPFCQWGQHQTGYFYSIFMESTIDISAVLFLYQTSTVIDLDTAMYLGATDSVLTAAVRDGFFFYLPTGLNDTHHNSNANVSITIEDWYVRDFAKSVQLEQRNNCSTVGVPKEFPLQETDTDTDIKININHNTWDADVKGTYALQLMPYNSSVTARAAFTLRAEIYANDPEQSPQPSSEMIAVIVVCSVVGAVLIGLAIYFVVRRCQRKDYTSV